jgi:replication factor C subunit 1
VGQQVAAKKEAEEKKVMEMAKEMELQAKERAKAQAEKGAPVGDYRLWTEKHAPTKLKELIGNKSLVDKLQKWLHDWYTILMSH